MLRPKLGRIWSSANAVTRRDPGDAKYLIGWLSEIPTYQVLNYLQYKTDTTIQALAERGVLEWGSDVTYKKGAAVWDETNGVMYVSLLANPSTTLKPSSNLTQWAPAALQITRKSYDDILAAITAHITDVTGNPHKLTPGRLGTYTTAQIDALVAQYRAEVQTHANNKNNPHGVTAAQAGAVPITGGTYSGNVTMGTGQLLLSADGKSLVKADSTGVYMANANGSVGVDNAGKGFVKVGSAARSEIVTQSTFADNKKTTEPDYATPQPIFYMPFLRDINIYVGGGIATDTFTAGMQFDSGGRYIMNQVQGTAGGGALAITPNPLTGIVESTVALDVVYNTTNPGSTAEAFSVGFGTAVGARNRIYPKSGGIIVGRSAVALAGPNIGDGKVHRVVQRITATSVALFVDGVLVASDLTTAQQPIGNTTSMIGKSTTAVAADLVNIGICNLRAWDSALTDNQISAL